MSADLAVAVVETAAGPLLIRHWRESDADALVRVVTANIDHLRPFLPWVQHEPVTAEQRRAQIADWTADVAARRDWRVGLFVADEIVGGAGLHPRIGPTGLEIGYWVDRQHVRRGIATAAAAALTSAAFDRPDIDHVEIHHDAANVASAGVPATLSFRRVDVVARPIAAPSESGSHVVWRVTRAEWSVMRP